MVMSGDRAEPGIRVWRKDAEGNRYPGLQLLSLPIPVGWTVGATGGQGPPYWTLRITPPPDSIGRFPTGLTVSVYRKVQGTESWFPGYREPSDLELVESPPFLSVDGLEATHRRGSTRRKVCFDAFNLRDDDGCGITSPLRSYVVAFKGPNILYTCDFSESFNDPDYERYLPQVLELCSLGVRLDNTYVP